MLNEIIKSNVPKLTIHASITDEKRVKEMSRWHYHDELEILLIYEGEFSCQTEGESLVAKKGDLVFVNARIPHTTRTLAPTRHGMLQFREKDFSESEFDEILKYSLHFHALSEEPIKIIRDRELFDIAHKIITESISRGTAYGFFVRSGIYELLGRLYRSGVLKNREMIQRTPELEKISPALIYANKNYSDKIDLQTVSKLVGFDSSYFCRIFKSAIGATFVEYLNFVRICKAESLLGKTSLSILEISEAVGFSSISYFNRTFKKFAGCSPRHYRAAKYVAISKGEKENDLQR